jgi:lysophospholipase L1-like esterase
MHRARVFALLLMLAGTTIAAAAQGASGPRYLALGDSVSFGFITQAGFEYVNANNFIGFPTYAAHRAKLDVINAACPGETTGSFLSSATPDDGCQQFRTAGAQLHVSYNSTQLAFALDFLKSHPQTRLITVGLGADDVLLLRAACQGDPSCIATGLPAVLAAVAANMGTILTDLRATGFTGTIIVVNYYSVDYSDPTGTALTSALNDALAAAAAQAGGVVADVFTAFQAATVPAGGNTCNAGLLNASPANQFTCDVHPSQSGQMLIGKVVAQTFAAAKGGDSEQ